MSISRTLPRTFLNGTAVAEDAQIFAVPGLRSAQRWAPMDWPLAQLWRVGLPGSLAMLLSVVLVSPVPARDIHVNNLAGNDLLDGRSPNQTANRTGPVRTIGRALQLASQGDRIVLAATDEPYREALSLSTGRQWGTGFRPFTIDGQGAILDGTTPIENRCWTHYRGDVFRCRPERLTYQQLHLNGKPAERRHVETGARRLPQLDPLQWMLWRGDVYFRCEKGKLPRDYDLRLTGRDVGITLYHVRHVRIHNLVVQGFRLDGINAHDGVYHCTLENVVCRGNGRSGVSVGGASRAQLVGSLVGDNGHVQVRVEGLGELKVEASDVLDNTAPPFEVSGGELVVDGKPITDQPEAEQSPDEVPSPEADPQQPL